MHIHLDAIGGIAGDMFCAAMLDAFPQLEPSLLELLNNLPQLAQLDVQLEPAMDKGLTGKRFQVCQKGKAIIDTTHFILTSDNKHHCALTPQAARNSHQHHSWQTIFHQLSHPNIPDDVSQCAKGIYTLLAQAESRVHNVSLENVHLHEVGALDAQIDIISAAFLICQSKVNSWSVSALPWGGGTVRCEHGDIPVPAPATLELLNGFNWHDDGEKGERVTPTGAAILAWLKPYLQPISGLTGRTGYGFGNKKLVNRANVLRISSFQQSIASESNNNSVHKTQSIYVIQCDIDDMTPELLAIAQQQLRQHTAIVDLTSHTLQGKKQRWVTRLEILCFEQHLTDVCDAIFNQTSTLGLRFWQTQRFILPRTHKTVEFNQQQWPIKYAQRPNGERSCKLEADALLTDFASHYQRQKCKSEIEDLHPVEKIK